MPTEDVSAAAEMLDRGATRGSLEHSLNVTSLLERRRNAQNNRLLDRHSQWQDSMLAFNYKDEARVHIGYNGNSKYFRNIYAYLYL